MSDLDPKHLIEKYLSEAYIMQLATSRDDQPWICSLHFVADEDSNVYWLSKTTRRHSEDVERNAKAAIAIAVQTEKPLIGIQAEGRAELMTNADAVRSIMEMYIERHGTDKGFAESIIEGTNEHKIYKFSPKSFNLFDQAHFADQPSQTWIIDNR